MVENKGEVTTLTPKEYFENVKGKKKKITDEKLKEIYDNSLYLANKYQQTGQVTHLKKLIYCMEVVEREKEIISAGVNVYVEREDIEEFIEKVSGNPVKVIELENYPREIPDDVFEIYMKVKHLFDVFYIVYTDYTGKEEKKIEKKRREKDPILFGTLQNIKDEFMLDRFYYIADWIDEHCDLTLEKMTTQMKAKTQKDIQKITDTPKNLEELKEMVNQAEIKNGKLAVDMAKVRNSLTKKKSFLGKVKSFIGMNK